MPPLHQKEMRQKMKILFELLSKGLLICIAMCNPLNNFYEHHPTHPLRIVNSLGIIARL